MQIHLPLPMLLEASCRKIAADDLCVWLMKGTCMTLMSVRVYYVTCDVITSGFASFPATPTGAEPSSLVAAEGRCVDGATTTEGRPAPLGHCKADGSWLLVTGGCQCAPGYQPSGQLRNVCTSTHFTLT